MDAIRLKITGQFARITMPGAAVLEAVLREERGQPTGIIKLSLSAFAGAFKAADLLHGRTITDTDADASLLDEAKKDGFVVALGLHNILPEDPSPSA